MQTDSALSADQHLPVSIEYNWQHIREQYQKDVKKHRNGDIYNIVMIILALAFGFFIAPQVIAVSEAQRSMNERTENQLYYTNHITVSGDDSIFKDNDLENTIQAATWIMLLVSVASGVSLLLLFYNSKKSRLDKGNYVYLERSDFKPIWQFIDEALLKMELDHYNVQLCYFKTNALEAHVSVKDETITLYLSRGLINLFSTNVLYFKSILFHELGHVLQKDKKLLQISNRIFWFPAILFVIAFLISAFNGNFFKSYVGMFGIIFLSFSRLFLKRRNAEMLADTAALAYLENTSIKDVIQKIFTPKISIWYPTQQERLLNIEGRLAKNKLVSTDAE
ncbi:M48 family metalloprotease [Chitinophaga eiseniae]|uniref:M48 family metalloprotease n=1 Tax=Chitinophaga eiseniae TaxID=634771 RepID=A0A847SMD8_9BACT|nr:M48 family metalloprotease [Chitinophaga eiseniae]NLR77112.1 M48 family metalloprotease [Chitinophaga eiseniae]